MKLTRRVLSLVLSLCMIISMFSGLTLMASAEDAGYTLVTDASNLAAGNKVIIAAATRDFAMGASAGKGTSDFRNRADITKDGDILTPGEGVSVFTLEDAGDGKFAFNDGTGYLTAADGANYLLTSETLEENGKWTVTIGETGEAAIVAESSTSKGDKGPQNIRHNNSSPRFSCYSSGQEAVALYKQTTAIVDPDPPVDDGIVKFVFMDTSDLHGQIYATDYTVDQAQSGAYKRGLTRVATYIDSVRAEYGADNVFVADSGDTIQGTPFTYYYAFQKPEVDDPAVKALRTIGYDMWVVGNHEFNYGLNILNRQLDYATSASTETEKQMAVSMANYLDAATNSDESKDWATWKGYAPYVIREFQGVKVAVMGIGNPNIAKWDSPDKWEGIYFANPIETYKHYEQEMLDNADMIVLVSHSGVNSEAGSDYIEELVQQTNTIDFVFAGHEHQNRVLNIANKDGENVPVVQPFTKARAIGQVVVTFDKSNGTYELDATVPNMEGKDLDENLVELLKPYEDATWNEYMNEPLGTASGDFPAANLGTAPSAFMDFVNTVQMWGAYDRTGLNTPDDASDDTIAQLSISAPLTSGSNANLIPAGDITLGDLFRLYRFENWFYQIRMSGKEVRTWLEFAATKVRIDGEGNPYVTNGDLTYYDTIYGEGFSYTIDCSKEAGSRITSMTYNGEEVKDDDTFTVVVNNYRYNGGGNYVKYLNDNGCEFIANDPDRVIYSTQFDMIQGEDLGQARSLIADYIREKKTIDPTITSTWKVIVGEEPPVEEYDTIAEALAGADGAEFTVKGVVTMVDGKNVYLQDATGGICAYLPAAPEGIALGDTVVATGARATFRGLPELSSATVELSEGLELAAAEKTVDTLTTADICTYVTIKNLEVTDIFDNNGAYSLPNLTVKDENGNEIQIYKAVIGKNEDGTWALAVGDKINFTGAVGVNNTTLQLRNTVAEEIEKIDAPAPEKEEVVVLYTNDVHTYIDKGLSYENIAALKAELEAEGKNVVLVDAGDHIQGTAYGSMDKGATIIKLMNAAGYDLATLGNHEFDYGMARTLEITGEESNFDYVSANFYHEKDGVKGDSVLDAYKVFDFNGTKVAFVGITTPESFTKSTPAYFQDENGNYIYGIAGGTDGKDLYNTVQAAIDAAHEEADVVIALGHLGVDMASSPWTSRELIANTTGLDAFIDGHSHSDVEMEEVKDKDGNTVILTQTGSYFGAIGKMTIATDGKVSTELVKEYTGVDEDVKAIADAWKTEIDTKLGTVIGHADVTFDNYDAEGKRLVRKTETNTGDFAADALYYLFDNMDLDVDVAIMNGGGVRNKAITGDLSYKSCKDIHTFGNVACLQTVTGQQILDALEWGAKDYPNECGGFLQVSGLTYEIHDYVESTVQKDEKGVWAGAPTGEYRVKNVKVWNKDTEAWEDLDLEAKYNLAGYNYTLRDLGDGFAMFDGAVNVLDYVMEDYMVLANYVASFPVDETTKLPTITAENSPYGEVTGEGRIVHVAEKPAEPYQFAVLSTTDMHGRATKNDVATQKEETNSMERVATIVKAQREIFGDDMLLIDDGDLIQGTLVAQYAITKKADVENPMITILKDLGYDAWVMGNHEFNFTPDQRDTQIHFAEDAGIATLGGNIVLTEDGKNIHGEDVKAGDSFYDPYVIKTLDAGNGRQVRVAIIGLGNAANATWDLATNYPNMQFSSLDNPDGLLENEINKWTQRIVDEDLADIIIVSAHSGKGTDDGIESDNFMLESQALNGAKNANNVDLLIYGHDHRANIEKVTNADGKEIYMVDGGGTTVTKNVFTVEFDEDGNVSDFTVTAEALPLRATEADEEMSAKMQPWYEETFAWASAPLGTFNNGWDALVSESEGKTNDDMLMKQTALSDFIHKAQIWSTWQSYEELGIEGATVSIASPVFGTDKGVLSFVPHDGDTISTLELAKLYRYSNNLMCAVDMTPEQLYNWISKVADMYIIKDGEPARDPAASIYGMDSFYGVDYTLDLTKPAGERVVSVMYNGKDLLEHEGTIRVALNSYRLSGGYGFAEATGLSEADCCWTANMYLGADRAPVPTQLGEYVAHMGTVAPTDKVSHGTDSTWTLIVKATEPDPEISTIADAKSGNEGDAFTVKGVVTMIDRKSVYVQDATGGICAYMAEAPAELALGDTIVVTGNYKLFNDLPELDQATFELSEGLELTAAEKTIAELTNDDLCTYVALKDLEITEVFDNDGAYANPNLTVKDAEGNTIQIYRAIVSKNEDGTWALAVGDVIDFNGAVGINRGNLQLRHTVEEELTKHDVPTPPEKEEVVVLYTNDVHTYIDKGLSYENIAALKKELEAEGKNVVLVDAGDHIQGTAYGSMDKGATIIKLMNAAGYDLATLGNHEFDYGMARTLEITGEESNFDYVSANFYHEKDGVKGDSVLDAYKVFDFNGTKVAFVGITTPESFTKSTPAYFQDENGNYIYGIAGGTDGKDLYNTVQAAIDAAHEEADVVIALGHLGVDMASSPWTSRELIANTTGLDAFIDGHSHSDVEMEEVKDKDGNTVILTQTGSYFGAIGKMTIATDGKVSTELVKEYTGVDEDVKAIADAWKTEIDTKLGTVIGHADVTFDNYDAEGKRLVRKTETNTGDFAADALYYLFDNMDLDVDVAIMNGGGVRNKAITGDLSYKSCKDIHTFGNVACLQTVTGQQILDALEWGAKDYPNECGGFLQVSGLTYEIHDYVESTVQKDEKGVWAGAPTGEYRVKNVKVWNKDTEAWEDLDLEAKYNLAGYNYTLRDLGDGFAMFDGAVNVLDYVMEDYMVLANYVASFPVDETTKLPTITAENSPYGEVTGEGRIVHVATTGDVCDRFEDIDQNRWYHSAVHYMIENGLMFGMTDTNFGIGNDMRRADLVCLLYRQAGSPAVDNVTLPFTDVDSNRYYINAVKWAYKNKIVAGMTPTTFAPMQSVTREQVVSIIYRYAKGTPVAEDHLAKFDDKDQVHDYAVASLNWAIANGIIAGMGADHLAPRAVATREQVCRIVMLQIELAD